MAFMYSLIEDRRRFMRYANGVALVIFIATLLTGGGFTQAISALVFHLSMILAVYIAGGLNTVIGILVFMNMITALTVNQMSLIANAFLGIQAYPVDPGFWFTYAFGGLTICATVLLAKHFRVRMDLFPGSEKRDLIAPMALVCALFAAFLMVVHAFAPGSIRNLVFMLFGSSETFLTAAFALVLILILRREGPMLVLIPAATFLFAYPMYGAMASGMKSGILAPAFAAVLAFAYSKARIGWFSLSFFSVLILILVFVSNSISPIIRRLPREMGSEARLAFALEAWRRGNLEDDVEKISPNLPFLPETKLTRSPLSIVNRISLTDIGVTIYDGVNRRGPLGLDLLSSFYTVLPASVSGSQADETSLGSAIVKNYGVLAKDDVTTGISVDPFYMGYALAGDFGHFLTLTLYLPLFLVVGSLFKPWSHCPFGLLFVASNTHLFNEYGYGSVFIFFTRLLVSILVTYILIQWLAKKAKPFMYQHA